MRKRRERDSRASSTRGGEARPGRSPRPAGSGQRSLETRLEAWGFLRVHRAELVQAARVRALHPRGLAAELELDDGQRVPVSRRLVAAVRKRIQG